MSRIGTSITPGTAGFLATLVLVGSFAILASTIWISRHAQPTTVAIEDVGGAPAVAPAMELSVPAESSH